MFFSLRLYLISKPLLLIEMAVIGWRYVFVADYGALHCQTTMKFEASHNLSF
jgi:hypothetical protein